MGTPKSILYEASCPENWQCFYEHKLKNRHLSAAEAKALLDFMQRKGPCVPFGSRVVSPALFPINLP